VKRLLLVALAAAAAACGHAPARRTVTVEGWTPVSTDPGPVVERRAVFDALRRAIEDAGGVRLDARTMVRQGATADSRMVARSAGCVLRHEVLSWGRGNDGVFARVKAEVSREPADCAGRGPVPPAALEDATLTVRAWGEGRAGARAATAAQTAIRGALTAEGLTVLDAEGDYRLTATVVVLPQSDARLLPFRGARVVLSVRLVSVKDGRVLSETRHEAAALDLDLDSAAGAAAASSAAPVAAQAIAALGEAAWLRP
jgi:hypothetical protein